MKVKLVPFIRANKPQFDKTDAIIYEGRTIGLVQFGYGRCDPSDDWTVWDISIKIPLDNEYHRTGGQGTYTQSKKKITEQLEEILEGDEYTIPDDWTETYPSYTTEGTCPYPSKAHLIGRRSKRIRSKADVEPEWTTRPLKAPLHEDLSICDLSGTRYGTVTIK